MPNKYKGGPRAGAAECNRCMHTKHRLARLENRVRSVMLAVITGLIATGASYAQAADTGGTPETRAAALRAIPFDEMNEATRTKLAPVLKKPTIYRQMPSQVIDCDPDLFLFLIRYPEVIVNIWQLMDVTQVQVERTGPFTLNAADGAGTISKVELIYGRPDLHIYYADGYYEGPLLRRRIEGDCVLILRSEYTNRDGRMYVTNQLDAFIRMENAGVDILLKTLHPLMGRTADYNFVETVKFVGQVSRASEANGAGMERLSTRLTKVAPDIRSQFAKHTDVVYQRGILRQNAQTSPGLQGNPFNGRPTTRGPLTIEPSSATRPQVEIRR